MNDRTLCAETLRTEAEEKWNGGKLLGKSGAVTYGYVTQGVIEKDRQTRLSHVTLAFLTL